MDVRVEHFLARGANSQSHRYSAPEAFIGYHSDACASVVLRVTEGLGPSIPADRRYREVLEAAKLLLLDCATPDAVVRLSASQLGLPAAQALSREYYGRQPRGSFADFVHAHLRKEHPERRAVFTEVSSRPWLRPHFLASASLTSGIKNSRSFSRQGIGVAGRLRLHVKC